MKKTTEVGATFTARDRFSSVVAKMQAKTSRFSSIMGKMGLSMSRVGTALKAVGGFAWQSLKTGALMATGAVIGAAYAADRMIDEMDALAKTTRAIGFPIEEFQEFRFAAEQSGVDTEAFNKSLTKFSKSLGEVKGGYGILTTALRKSDPKFLQQLKNTDNVAEAFDLYLSKIKSIPDASKKAALANAAFGRGSIEMVNLANIAGDELEGLRAQMRENGVVTADQAKVAEDFNDTFNRLKLTGMSVFRDVVMPMVPGAINAAESVRKWVTANKDLIRVKVREWADKVKQAIKDLYNWFVKNWPVIKKTAGQLVEFGKGVASFVVKLWDLRYTILALASATLAWKTAVAGVKLAETAAEMAAAGGAAAKAAPLIGGLSKVLGNAGLVTAAAAAGVAVGLFVNSLLDAKNKTAQKSGNKAVKSQRGLESASMDDLNKRLKMLKREESRTNTFGGHLTDILTPGSDTADALKEIRNARAAIQGEQMRRLQSAVQAGTLAAPQVATSESRTTTTERTELVIRDETGRAEITRGGKKGTVKLVPTGAMP